VIRCERCGLLDANPCGFCTREIAGERVHDTSADYLPAATKPWASKFHSPLGVAEQREYALAGIRL
jgi:hypothetical protein